MTNKALPVRHIVLGLTVILTSLWAVGVFAQATRPAPAGWTVDGDVDNGKIVYKQYCQKCHGREKQKGERRFDLLSSEIRSDNDLVDYQDILDQLIEDRMDAEGSEDTVARIVRTGLDGGELSTPLIRMVLNNLLIGGTATTRDAIGNLLLEVLTNPELHADLRARRRLIPAAIEESLRLMPPVLYLIRTCSESTELSGVAIEAGERVVVGIASANRDERIFDDADQFRVDRVRPAMHLSFGYGKHFCVGAPLARMEIEEAMNAFFDRFEAADIHLTGDFELEWMPMPYMLGPLRLDVEIVQGAST